MGPRESALAQPSVLLCFSLACFRWQTLGGPLDVPPGMLRGLAPVPLPPFPHGLLTFGDSGAPGLDHFSFEGSYEGQVREFRVGNPAMT